MELSEHDHSQVGLIELTAEIVAAFVSHNTVRQDELSLLIGEVHAALRQGATAVPAKEEAPQEPAVSIRSSVKQDHIVCLEDGKTFKSLKRHLRTDHNLSPEEYRAKWGLKPDYPMVAPSYAQARSELAKSMGLGRKADVPSLTKSKAVNARRPRKQPATPTSPAAE